ASVDFTQSQPSPERSLVEYTVIPGEKHKLKAIRIEGNTYFDTETLRERMYIQPASMVRFRSGRYSPRMLEGDLNAIRTLYRTNGFREVEVTSRVDRDPLKNSIISVVIQIVEGRQWLVNTLELAGSTRDDLQYLRSVLRSTDGQPFSEA